MENINHPQIEEFKGRLGQYFESIDQFHLEQAQDERGSSKEEITFLKSILDSEELISQGHKNLKPTIQNYVDLSLTYGNIEKSKKRLNSLWQRGQKRIQTQLKDIKFKQSISNKHRLKILQVFKTTFNLTHIPHQL